MTAGGRAGILTKSVALSIIAPAMGTQGLPRTVDVVRFCGGRGRAEATLMAEQLPRLSAALADSGWSITVRLSGESPGTAIYRIAGSAEGELPVTCRRCLSVVQWPLALRFSVVVVQGDEEEARWIADSDTWRGENDRLPLAERVEDELLLAVPDLPECSDGACEARAQALHGAGGSPGPHGE